MSIGCFVALEPGQVTSDAKGCALIIMELGPAINTLQRSTISSIRVLATVTTVPLLLMVEIRYFENIMG